jgi:CRISPR/Cas system CMR-associated protein Cmr1 (group 7 of RAMP superfamily)
VPGWTFTGLSGNSGPVPDEEAMKIKKPGAWLPNQVAEYGYKKMSEGKFYIICPDNDVHEELDQARMTWVLVTGLKVGARCRGGMGSIKISRQSG